MSLTARQEQSLAIHKTALEIFRAAGFSTDEMVRLVDAFAKKHKMLPAQALEYLRQQAAYRPLRLLDQLDHTRYSDRILVT